MPFAPAAVVFSVGGSGGIFERAYRAPLALSGARWAVNLRPTRLRRRLWMRYTVVCV